MNAATESAASAIADRFAETATVHLPAHAAPSASSSNSRRLEIGLALALLALIVALFWSQQRYPALLHKLHAGTRVQVKGAISFDALLPVRPSMPLPTRVARTGVNWLWTNRFGMYFALPFGATLMTLFGLMAKPRHFNSAAANVMCGTLAGAPMGVCTNCATPIAQSLIHAGASTRLSVAAMISSPSFNPVVVALSFLLFPVQLGLLRLAVPATLLLLLPWLVPEKAPRFKPLNLDWNQSRPAPSVVSRLKSLAATLGRNLLRITWMTLPWMLLAALVGALAAELIPAYGTHLHAAGWSILAVAILGTLLPVPMALDVALAFVLYGAGAPVPFVAVLLCTLGPVSIYSLSALGKQLGAPTALRLGGATAALGFLTGLAVMITH